MTLKLGILLFDGADAAEPARAAAAAGCDYVCGAVVGPSAAHSRPIMRVAAAAMAT